MLPLCCREKLWEVEVKQAEKVCRGYLPAHLLEPIAVPVVSLQDAVACWSMAPQLILRFEAMPDP